jgi:hypothetical protein
MMFEQNAEPVVMLFVEDKLHITLNRKFNKSEQRAFTALIDTFPSVLRCALDRCITGSANTCFMVAFMGHMAHRVEDERAAIFSAASSFMADLPPEMVNLSLF